MNFNVNYDIKENKIFIETKLNIVVDVYIYEWNSFLNTTDLLYVTTSNFNNNEFWYSTYKQLSDLKGVLIIIKKDDDVIKEQYFNFKTIHNENIKKQVLVLHSQVGIGDNLAATPLIKKVHDIFNQKVIVLTYLPFVFINNPYIEQVIKIDNNNINDVINSYDKNSYDIHNIFDIMNLNWRMVDHKQLCAYNFGLQLKPTELGMQFYPDDFIDIENLPDNFICINPSETEPERTWGNKNWQTFIDLIQEHIPVVAIGKNTYLDPNLSKTFSNINIKNGLNLLNHESQNTLSQAYHIICKSKTFVTMNNGLYILSLCNLHNHITELATSWDTSFYRMRNGFNINYLKGKCEAMCLSNPKISIEYTGGINILKSGVCYLNKPSYECHPTPHQVYESVLEKISKPKISR
jgi:hypothetical protein